MKIETWEYNEAVADLAWGIADGQFDKSEVLERLGESPLTKDLEDLLWAIEMREVVR